MLENSCASYVQLTAAPAIIDNVVEVNPGLLVEDVRFIRENDEFVLKQDVPSQRFKRQMYLPSEKKMEEFRQTLARFIETLQKRKFFNRLGVPARDPADFDLDYVLSIAVKVSEWNHKSDEINFCRRFARQLCQKGVKHNQLLWGLISLAPTDIYGSLISGGFTMAVAAMEAHEKLQAEMEKSLARIPEELSKIKTLKNVYIQRDELHKHADDVLVSIFTVLERIIERMSRTWRENLSFKSKDNGGSVRSALDKLSESIAEFNNEAGVCAQLRMGRIEETGQAVKVAVESTRDVVHDTSTKVTNMESKLKDICENQEILLQDRTCVIGLMNQLYSFMASNPAFNAVDGTVDRKYLLSNDRNGDLKRRNELVERWFMSLGDFEPSPKDDIKMLVEHAETLALKEQDRVQYVMACQQFEDWLGKPRSSVLCVRAETAPEDTINFMSVSTALLALTLGGATGFIVLSCFCSLRKKASPRPQDSGALGIMKSLNGQLLRVMRERELLIKLPVDQDDKVWGRSNESVKHSCALLRKLMAVLPPGSVVFVLLDSVSRISGDKGLVDGLMEKIIRIGDRSPGIVVKLLVTDPIPSSHIRSTADISLYVPDDVDGWECGMNVKSMKRNNALKLRDMEELRES